MSATLNSQAGPPEPKSTVVSREKPLMGWVMGQKNKIPVTL